MTARPVPEGDGRRCWMGRAVFAAGLAAWAWLSLKLLPYGYHDLRYLFSLEQGLCTPAEWVHPLFVPLLGGLRSLMGLFGYSGRMLVPLELMNLAAAGLALAGLFRIAERLCEDSLAAAPSAKGESPRCEDGGSLAAALAALLLGFSYGFWEGALRPDPYAFAAAGSTATLILLMGRWPAHDCRRYAFAGVLAGLTAGFHVSGLALVLVAALGAWQEAGLTRRGARLSAAFLGGLALALVAGYAVFAAYYGITPDYFRRAVFSDMFGKIEQMPLSSIYTSRDPVKQALDFLRSLEYHGAVAMLVGAAGSLGLLFLLRRGRLTFSSAQSRALGLSIANFLAYGLFFLVNNTQNGFVYGALLCFPVLLAVLAGAHELLPAFFVPAAAAVVAFHAWMGLALGPQGDPLFREGRFLESLLRPGDILIVPGCPFPEILFQRRFNILEAGDLADPRAALVPQYEPQKLRRRIFDELRQGRGIYFAAGDFEPRYPGQGDDNGSQKRRQVFWVTDAGSPATARRVVALSQGLQEAFSMDCRLVSAQGWRYCRLRLKPAARTGPGPLAWPAASMTGAERDRLSKALAVGVSEPFDRMRMRYLLDWLAEVPGDSHVQHDIVSFLLRQPRFAGRYEMSRAAIARRLREVARAQGAVAEARWACFELERGRQGEALRRWEKAVDGCAACVRHGLGSPAARSLQALRRTCGRSSWSSPLVRWFLGSFEESTGLKDKGISFFRAGRLREAEAAFREALELDGENISARMNLAALLVASGKRAQAVACYDHILSLNPDNAALRAEALAARTAALGPPSSQGGRSPHPEGATALALPGKPERAGKARQEARAALVRKRSAGLADKGISFFRAGRRREAQAAFQEALKLDQGNMSIWMSLGALLAVDGKAAQAVACYDRILSLKPENQDFRADTLAARANALALLGRPEQARRDRLEALAIASPSWPWRADVEASLKFILGSSKR